MTEQCPTDEDLAAFVDGWPYDRPRIEAHLVGCATCGDIVMFVVRMKDMFPDPKERTPYVE